MQPDPATPGIARPQRPCLDCGTPTSNTGTRCDLHASERNRLHNNQNAYYRTAEWRSLRRACLDRDHDRCIVCTDTYRLTAHHVHARDLGGTDAIENLATLCGRCHSSLEAGNPTIARRLREHRDLMRSYGSLH